jgi:endonuclease YncB( thermonuclease family)
MHTFHGSFIRQCVVTHVIDGKTIRVLLNPDGGQQRTASGDGWADSLVLGSTPGQRQPSEEFDASPLDPMTWEKVDVRLIYVDTEEALQPKKEEAAYKVRSRRARRDEKRREETRRDEKTRTDPNARARHRQLAADHALGTRIVRLVEETSRRRARRTMRKRGD